MSGWSASTAATAMSLRLPNNWRQDHAQKLYIIAKGEDWVRQIDHFRGDKSFNRHAAIKSVQEASLLSISTIQKLYNCGIMSDGQQGVDMSSHTQAQNYWGKKSRASYMQALITAAKYTIRVQRQLEGISDHAGGFDNGLPVCDALIDRWTGSVLEVSLPSEEVQLDLEFFELCLHLFRQRYETEKSNQSISAGSRATESALSGVTSVLGAQRVIQAEVQHQFDNQETVADKHLIVEVEVQHHSGKQETVAEKHLIVDFPLPVQHTPSAIGHKVAANSEIMQQEA